MTDLVGENAVIRMPPVSLSAIEALGAAFLRELAPECLSAPTALDVARLVDDVLPRHGIHVNPASAVELGNNEALTDPTGTTDIEILLNEDQFELLRYPGPRSFRPRATTCHEIGHAVMHVPVIRRRRELPHASLLLKRVAPDRMRTYEDPEWQAWAFAGCILMPRQTLRLLRLRTPEAVSAAYRVSTQFALAHLRRLRMLQ